MRGDDRYGGLNVSNILWEHDAGGFRLVDTPVGSVEDLGIFVESNRSGHVFPQVGRERIVRLGV